MTLPRDPAEERNPRRRMAPGTGLRSPRDARPNPAEEQIAEEHPRERMAPGRVRIAPVDPGQLQTFPFVPAAEEAVEAPPFVLPLPDTFEKMQFHVLIQNALREIPIVVEQTVPANSTGTVTVLLQANQVDIQRFFTEAGDGSIRYSIDIQSAGRTAVLDHLLTGQSRVFARFWEKTVQVIVNFTNTDLVNAALLQIYWDAIQIDVVKWLPFRDNVRALSQQFGIEP